MARHRFPTICFSCGADGIKSEFAWAAHADFCWPCMDRMVADGWCVLDRGPTYTLTPQGETALPALAVVAECPLDGTPIYRRWVDAGIAHDGGAPACPHCLGLAHLLT